MRIYNGTGLLVRHWCSWPRRFRGFQTSARCYKSTHYDVLGIKKSATQKEIKSAYIMSSKKYHPDVCSDPDAKQKFTKIVEAYEILGNPRSRMSYDDSFISDTYATEGAHIRRKSTTYRSDISKDDYFDVRKGINLRKSMNEEYDASILFSFVTLMDVISIVMLIAFLTGIYRRRRAKELNFIFPPKQFDDKEDKENKDATKKEKQGLGQVEES